jgi:glycosyltransferase involved in cell wall biosynthesis
LRNDLSISVVIPSRLQFLPGQAVLYLDRALRSVRSQERPEQARLEIVVGLDPGSIAPVRDGVRFVHATSRSQAAAVNAAAAAASGDFLAFLEDDDIWSPRRLPYGLGMTDAYDLITSNQTEVDEEGNFVRINDFATPSGWLLRKSTWDRLGAFDEALRFHVDTDFLGRANAAGIRRAHLVERDAPARSWIEKIRVHSDIARTNEPQPLVIRTVNPQGGMSRIARDPEAERISIEEHARFVAKYGAIPW